VGANVGLMTLAAAGAVTARGHVYAFEPVPACYEALLRNLELNGIDHVTAVRKALGSRPETLTIYEQLRSNRGSSSLLKPARFAGTATAQVMTLDDFLAERQVGPVAMLKVDVEGWEPEVLRGAAGLLSGPQPPMLIVECSSNHAMFRSDPRGLFDALS